MSTPLTPTSSFMEKPRVGISECLTGKKVRYDGKDQLADWHSLFVKHLTLVPFCPEVAAGLGVPRPPVQLIQSENLDVRARGVKDKTLDVTDALQSTAQSFTEGVNLNGFIFKSRSPSCGFLSTPLFDKNNYEADVGSGIFAETFSNSKNNSQCVLAEESWLTDKLNQAIFITCAYLHQALSSNSKIDERLFFLLLNDGIEKNKHEEFVQTRESLNYFLSQFTVTHNEKTALNWRFLNSQNFISLKENALIKFWFDDETY